eukprot:6212288-Pleurochrysis_carterae.AAC.5
MKLTKQTPKAAKAALGELPHIIIYPPGNGQLYRVELDHPGIPRTADKSYSFQMDRLTRNN